MAPHKAASGRYILYMKYMMPQAQLSAPKCWRKQCGCEHSGGNYCTSLARLLCVRQLLKDQTRCHDEASGAESERDGLGGGHTLAVGSRQQLRHAHVHCGHTRFARQSIPHLSPLHATGHGACGKARSPIIPAVRPNIAPKTALSARSLATRDASSAPNGSDMPESAPNAMARPRRCVA